MTGRSILLVEGKDDEHVVKHLCNHYDLPHIDEIVEHEGFENLIIAFPTRLKESDLGSLGVLVDADSDPTNRWQALRDRLHLAGYADVPDIPALNGTILDPPPESLLPRLGIWLMPDNRTAGALEDFLRLLVPADSTLLDHAEKSIDAIPREERRFALADRPKALIHTWLAWREKPGRPLGTAITARFLDADLAEVKPFVAWLRALFFPD